MKQIVHLVWAFCFYQLLSQNLTAQPLEYSIKTYSLDDKSGLNQNSIKTIFQDKLGYIWMATETGLTRFDGAKFKSYGASEIKGVQNERIYAMSISPEGEIMAQTQTDEFITTHQIDRNAAPFPKTTPEKYMVPFAGYVQPYNATLDSFNLILKITDNRFLLMPNSTKKGEIYFIFYNSIYRIVKNIATKIGVTDSSQTYKTTIFNDSIFSIIYQNKKVQSFVNGKPFEAGNKLYGDLENKKIELDLSSNHNNVWTTSATYFNVKGDIYKLKFEDGKINSKLLFKDTKIQEMSGFLYLEKENIYFVGSTQRGLLQINPHIFSYPTIADKFEFPRFYSHNYLGNGLFFARNHIFSKSGVPKKIPIWADDAHVNRVLFLKGNLLFYELNSDLFTYHFKTEENKRRIPLFSFISSATKDTVNDSYYFTTRFELYKVEKNDSITQIIRKQDSLVFTASNLHKNTHLLLGTQAGLKWFNLQTQKIEKSILDSTSIWSIYVENDQRIWISTYGKGFYLLENENLYTFPISDYKAFRTVHQFIEDGKNNFWLTTNNGLFKVNKNELLAYSKGEVSNIYYYQYTTSDGLRNSEFNGGSFPGFIWTEDSLLSLPSQDGIVWFYPNKLFQAFPSSYIYVEQLIINGKLATISDLKNLSAGKNEMQIEIASPFFGSSTNQQLEYQLMGYSNSWTKVPEDRVIIFQNLPGGNYELKLRQRIGFDYNSFEIQTIEVKIKPFFYNTWWFWCLSILFIMGISYLVTRIRTLNLRKSNILLEQKVGERTTKLEQSVLELEKSKTQLRESNDIKDRLISMVLHDLRSPIRFLELLSTNLAKNHKKLDENSLSERINEIKNSTASIYSFTNQFLTWSKAQYGLYKVLQEELEINVLFKQIEDLYAEIGNYQSNKLIIQPTDLKCITDPNLLTAVIRNLVDNSMKHTSGGEIRLDAKRKDNGDICIILKDTGTGMTASQIAAFYQLNSESSAGLGSTLIRDLLQKINAKYEIESAVNKGTTFTICLPQNHLPNHKP